MTTKTTDKILIIDDDAAVRQKISLYLEDGGFEVVEASDGTTGLEKFRKEKPDLVVIDLQMIGLSGLEVLDVLIGEAPQTSVVVASEVEKMADVIEALKRGASDYVMKPVNDLTVLEHAIAKTLERSRLLEQNRIYREQLEKANQALKKSLDILEQDQAAGRSVQMRLLPEQNVKFGAYSFAHGVDPSLYLSGDFVDYFNINDQKVGFYIADVSGHGASSAFVTVLLKSSIALSLTHYQTQGETTILEPNKLLAKISKEIHSAKLGKYLTIIYGVLDLETNVVDYSVGGHYPNPIMLETGHAKFIEGKSFPVGIMKEATYPKFSLEIPKNGQLVLFSDGVTEVLPQGDLAAKEKAILEMVEKNDGTIEYFRKELKLETKDGEKVGLPDDVTILLVKRA